LLLARKTWLPQDWARLALGEQHLITAAAAAVVAVCSLHILVDEGSGYLDQPWSGSSATGTSKRILALVRKDRMIAQNTASLCGTTMSTMPLRDLVTALAVKDVSEDLRDAIEDEVLVLQECTKILHDAAASLSARL
jgi:hypothetical protein